MRGRAGAERAREEGLGPTAARRRRDHGREPEQGKHRANPGTAARLPPAGCELGSSEGCAKAVEMCSTPQLRLEGISRAFLKCST